MFGNRKEINELRTEMKHLEESLKRAHDRISCLSLKANKHDDEISRINGDLEPLDEISKNYNKARAMWDAIHSPVCESNSYREDSGNETAICGDTV